MSKDNNEDKEKEDINMSAVARNYVYEIKENKAEKRLEPVISKELLARCKKVASKYPKK